MASDLEVTDGDAPGAAPARRIPDAVWNNRPSSPSGGSRLGVKTLAVAAVLGLVALLLTHTTTDSLVLPSASAGTDAGGAAGDGATGYFPNQFDQRRLPPGEQPPTF